MPEANCHTSSGLFYRLRHYKTESDPLQPLRDAAQLALQVEFTTIPPYLTALYSITDKSSKAYQALRSVAVEEMFHCNQAANIVIALGGSPRFTGRFAPTYPDYLPQSNPNSMPFIGLNRASVSVFDQVFSAIESPAPAGAVAQGSCYDTIAQLYDALSEAVHRYNGNPFDQNDVSGRQRSDIYIGKFGGKVIDVVDKDSFDQAVNEIVKQGEGMVPYEGPLVPVQRFGAYNHYGQRTDGTYGPIIGTPFEMSHFSKFRQVVMDPDNFPEVLPIVSNPGNRAYDNEDTELYAQAFDDCYSFMLDHFEKVFETNQSRDPYFGVVLRIMHEILPNLALVLMSKPAFENGNGSVGPNATPRWLYKSDVSFGQVKREIEALLQSSIAAADDSIISGSLRTACEAAQQIDATAESLGL